MVQRGTVHIDRKVNGRGNTRPARPRFQVSQPSALPVCLAAALGLSIRVANRDFVIAMDGTETLHRGSLRFGDLASVENYGGASWQTVSAALKASSRLKP